MDGLQITAEITTVRKRLAEVEGLVYAYKADAFDLYKRTTPEFSDLSESDRQIVWLCLEATALRCFIETFDELTLSN